MASEYTRRVRSIDDNNWDGSTLNVNIPGHTEERFASPSGKYEVEISPKNGYDDGNLHEDNLHFFVSVYEYYVEDGDRKEEQGIDFSRKVETAKEAADLAQTKINEYSQKDDA